MNWIAQPLRAIGRWLRARLRATQPRAYRLEIFDDRSRAAARARDIGVLAVYRSAGADKWCFFKCPCGCEQQVALNLMKSHHPVWRLVDDKIGPSLYPSVDSTTCGAHFLVRGGDVVWC